MKTPQRLGVEGFKKMSNEELSDLEKL